MTAIGAGQAEWFTLNNVSIFKLFQYDELKRSNGRKAEPGHSDSDGED